MVRLVLVGAGSHARYAHGPSLARYRDEHPGEVELVAVCDLDEAKAKSFQKDFGFGAVYSDLDAMLDAEKPDGIVSVMPLQAIVPISIHLFKRAVPCTVEKPPGETSEGAQQLLDAARETGAPHMVSVNRRFVPYLNRAREWAAGIGPLRFVRGSMFRNRRREDFFIWGTGVHAVDAMRHVAGDMTDMRVRVCRRGGLTSEWFELAFAFGSNCAGALHVFPTAGTEEETYELFGEGYRARVACWSGPGGRAALQCYRDGALVIDEAAPEGTPGIVVDGSYDEMRALIAALRDGSPLGPTVEDVYPSLDVCFRADEACRRADPQGGWRWVGA